MAYVPGIDVSHWEAPVEWSMVRAQGIRFAFIKATEGETYVDSTFDENWAGAKRAGILRGAYHFFHPNMNPTRQAERFIQTVRAVGDGGELPPVIDLEAADEIGRDTIISRAKTWIDRVQQTLGKRPIIYSSPYFLKDSFSVPGGGPPAWTKDYVLWIANYEVSEPYLPKGWLKWTFWQYTDKGRISGINTNVDLDWFNGTVAQLYQFAGVQLPGQGTYTVQSGDTLEGVAGRFGLSVAELIAANSQLIRPNMVLNVPAPGPAEEEPPPPPPPPQRTYTVRAGDTLTAIARRFGTTVGALVQVNGIENPDLIRVGQVLIIPQA